MATFLFIVSHHIGHLNATFRIANRLRSRGHTALYLGSRSSRRGVERQGFRFETAAFLDPPAEPPLPAGSPLPPRLRRLAALPATLRQRRHNVREWPRYVGWLLANAEEVVRSLRPDLLIFDPFMLIHYPLFWEHAVPAVVLSANPLLDWDPQVPPYTTSIVPSRSKWSDARVAAAWLGSWLSYLRRRVGAFARLALMGPSYPYMAKTLAAAMGFPLERERIDRPVWFDLCLRCVPELVLWTPSFEFPRARPFRREVHYIGPAVEMERIEDELDWSKVPHLSRLVYCSLGTVNLPDQVPKRIEFLRKVILAFKQLPDCALVIASGRTISPDWLRPWPANVAIWEEVPQIGVLRRADLLITHGGANSIKEGILSGVPLLVYPRRADQPGNAARVVYHGLGKRGNPRTDTPQEISTNVRHLLGEPAYRLRVARLREEFLEYELRDVPVITVESFLKHRPARDLIGVRDERV